jgi:hypothetical protein
MPASISLYGMVFRLITLQQILQTVYFLSIVFSEYSHTFFAKNLFIALRLASLKKSLPPHAYLYMSGGVSAVIWDPSPRSKI